MRLVHWEGFTQAEVASILRPRPRPSEVATPGREPRSGLASLTMTNLKIRHARAPYRIDQRQAAPYPLLWSREHLCHRPVTPSDGVQFPCPRHVRSSGLAWTCSTGEALPPVGHPAPRPGSSAFEGSRPRRPPAAPRRSPRRRGRPCRRPTRPPGCSKPANARPCALRCCGGRTPIAGRFAHVRRPPEVLGRPQSLGIPHGESGRSIFGRRNDLLLSTHVRKPDTQARGRVALACTGDGRPRT